MAGLSTLLSLIGTGGGMLSNWLNNQNIMQMNERNMQHETAVLDQQYHYNEQLAENADQRTRDLYNDLQSPDAIANQLEKAGMSIGLMYGNGGMGGNMQSGAQADAPSSQNRGTIAPSPIMDAQIAQLLATTAKTEAETENIKQNTEESEAREADTWENIPTKRKQRMLMDKQIDELENKIEQGIANIAKTGAETKLIEKKTETEEAIKESTEANTRYIETMTELNNIDLSTRADLNEQTINEIKAKVEELNASAAKMKTEEAALNEQREWLLKKTMYEALNNKTIYEELTPAQIQKLRQETESLRLNNKSIKEFEEALNNYGLNQGTIKIIKGILMAFSAAT